MRYERPKIEQTADGMRGLSDLKITHPAYAMLSVSHPRGGHNRMFGSELEHHAVVRIELSEAHTYRDTSYGERHHSGRRIAEWEMTEQQWVQFVGANSGGGVPVTLRYRHTEGFVELPGIAPPEENTVDRAKREVAEKAAAAVQKAREGMAKLDELLASPGTPTKKQLAEVRGLLRSGVEHFAANASYATECFKEHVDEIVTAGKTEIEGFVNRVAYNTGIEALRNGAAPVLQLDPPRVRRRSRSEEIYESFALEMTGKHCAECGEPQFNTPAGVTCKNGHGGAPSREEN